MAAECDICWRGLGPHEQTDECGRCGAVHCHLCLDYAERVLKIVEYGGDVQGDPPRTVVTAQWTGQCIGCLRDYRRTVLWVEEFVKGGVLESAFELDGGVHLTLSWPMEEVALRDKNSFMDAVWDAMELPQLARITEDVKRREADHGIS